jgi:hypothetical protein
VDRPIYALTEASTDFTFLDLFTYLLIAKVCSSILPLVVKICEAPFQQRQHRQQVFAYTIWFCALHANASLRKDPPTKFPLD